MRARLSKGNSERDGECGRSEVRAQAGNSVGAQRVTGTRVQPVARVRAQRDRYQSSLTRYLGL